MNSDWIIRRATEADADYIIGFQQQMALESEGLELDRAKLEPGVKAALDPERLHQTGIPPSGCLQSPLLHRQKDGKGSRHKHLQVIGHGAEPLSYVRGDVISRNSLPP